MRFPTIDRRLAVVALLCVTHFALSARIQMQEFAIDLTEYIPIAPIIFRGTVLDDYVFEDNRIPARAIARLEVQRWYRGEDIPTATVYYGVRGIAGHNCINLKPGTHWLIFATEQNGHLEFVDDCYGAVTVSPLIAPALPHPDVLAQLEADFEAGSADADPANRLVSIQRMGGLKSALSRPALHRIIENGNETEKNWATYAALRGGDTTILSRVREMLTRDERDVPTRGLAWDLGQLRDKAAIPELIEITKVAKDSNARMYAIAALGEKLHASEALPAIAARLADSDSGVRFYALEAMRTLTGESACRLPMEPRHTQDMIEPQIQYCLAWWSNEGKIKIPQQ
jgi:HEAT repeats